MSSRSILVVVLLSFFCGCVASKRYHAHDKTSVVANTVGPFNNPTETYPVRCDLLKSENRQYPPYNAIYMNISLIQYYSLPFCEGTGRQRRHKQDLGETLSGSRKTATPYELTFLDPVPWRSLCEEYLDAKDVRWDSDFFPYPAFLTFPYLFHILHNH
jgi:hypothetical protein